MPLLPGANGWQPVWRERALPERNAAVLTSTTVAGRWALMPETQPSIGRHRLRVDQISPADGRVLARAEVPFQREELPAEAFAQQRIVVQPGNNLWRIARATYGRGTRYTVIYQANKDQIADPNRIFPGQVFALPTAQPAPAASSRSR